MKKILLILVMSIVAMNGFAIEKNNSITLKDGKKLNFTIEELYASIDSTYNYNSHLKCDSIRINVEGYGEYVTTHLDIVKYVEKYNENYILKNRNKNEDKDVTRLRLAISGLQSSSMLFEYSDYDYSIFYKKYGTCGFDNIGIKLTIKRYNYYDYITTEEDCYITEYRDGKYVTTKGNKYKCEKKLVKVVEIE